MSADYGFDKPRFDGKIAGMIWRGSAGANLGNNISSMHAYGYDYDLGGRLKLADYYLQQEYNGQGQVDPWSKTLLDFTVSNLYYDKNGNIPFPQCLLKRTLLFSFSAASPEDSFSAVSPERDAAKGE